MNLFSERLELARAAVIVDDAPRWLRAVFFESAVRNLLARYPRVNPQYQLNALSPLGAEALVERLAQLMRLYPGSEYLKPGYAMLSLKDLLLDCEWFYFYDFIEIISVDLRTMQRAWQRSGADCFDEFRLSANLIFRNSGIGWNLDAKGTLERTAPEEQAVAEAQLSAIELHSPAKVHLAKAKLMLNQRPCDSANVIKESISAIESAGCKAYPNVSTLGDVIKEIRKRSDAPGMMLQIIEKMYGFASSEPGVRHGNSKDERVTRAEAEFIYVNSLSIISYLEALGLL